MTEVGHKTLTQLSSRCINVITVLLSLCAFTRHVSAAVEQQHC